MWQERAKNGVFCAFRLGHLKILIQCNPDSDSEINNVVEILQ